MVMDQFVTTYRKDFLWPYVTTLGLKPHPERHCPPSTDGKVPCACHCYDDSDNWDKQRALLGPLAYEQESWSRLGPMGPLLDPKLYPAKVSAAPESHVTRFNQPNVFLEKLNEKYPFIYECLRVAPPDDLLSRINKDRLRTTYQVDYCKQREYPDAPYDELLRAAGVDGMTPCPEPVALPESIGRYSSSGELYRVSQGDICKMYQKSKITANGMKSGGRSGQPCGGIAKAKEAQYCVGSCKGPLSSITHGNSEYQDAISRLGTLIIRDRIHDPTVKRSKYEYSSKK